MALKTSLASEDSRIHLGTLCVLLLLQILKAHTRTV